LERSKGVTIDQLIKPQEVVKKSVTLELTDEQLEKVKKLLDNG
jgi:hypothetical protein